MQLESVSDTTPLYRPKQEFGTVSTPTPTPITTVSPTPIAVASPASNTPTHQPTQVVHAMYTDTNGQPVYILQNVNSGHALIPLQFQQPGGIPVAAHTLAGTPSSAHTTLTSSMQMPNVTIPSTLKLDGCKIPGLSALQSPAGLQKSITVAQTFTPPTLENLIQPRLCALPHTNGGMLPSEAGPIRSHTRQAAKERPSPVPVDGR